MNRRIAACLLGLATLSAPAAAHGRDILSTAADSGSFETLVAALTEAHLTELLGSEGPFTVFAPTDEAFAQLPDAALQALLREENREQLAELLSYQVVPGRVSAAQAIAAGSSATLAEDDLSFFIDGGRLQVAEAGVIANDVEASNGVIHVIDTVLMPPSGLQLAPSGRLVIGIYNQRPSASLAAQLDIDRDRSMLITGLTSGGNAAAAGLEKYDIVLEIDGQPATDENLSAAKQRAGFLGEVSLAVLRKGERREVHVVVGSETH
jgi:uncharacterized surface protein with fasciclin (FAS1) repeats